MEENKKIEVIGDYGAALSIIEIGLGSFLHALHIPFSGVCLSLNQGFILCRATLLAEKDPGNQWTPYTISNVAAVLKSLSPAGKKLGPMLSLSMQGLLFNLGVITFGVNPVGLCLGMIFLSLWAFIQPLVTYYLFFGEKLFTAAEYLFKKTLPYHGLKFENLVYIFIAVVVTKMFVGCALAILAWRTKGKKIYGNKYDQEFVKLAKDKGIIPTTSSLNPRKAALLAIKDLFRPLFLISILITGIFLYFSNHDYAQIIWYLLRPIAIGFIFFYISRTLTLDRWLLRLQAGRFRAFSLGCQTALTKIRSFV